MSQKKKRPSRRTGVLCTKMSKKCFLGINKYFVTKMRKMGLDVQVNLHKNKTKSLKELVKKLNR